MKVLVIHPKDVTTDFLCEIYENRGWEVIRTNESNSYINKRIQENDRIIMMGHGTPYGLIGHGRMFINSTHVGSLKEKEIVAIWCNADQFVNKYDLHGFYTGMIISEVGEANYFGIVATQDEIDYSNKVFSNCITHGIDKEFMLSECVSNYMENIVEVTPVIEFNLIRMFHR